jgi:hypothetical protein
MGVAMPQLELFEAPTREAGEIVAGRASVADLEVAPTVSAKWGALDSRVRQPVAALFDRSCVVAGRGFAVRGRCPRCSRAIWRAAGAGFARPFR